jgi:ATP synthase, F1 delta subunit
MAADPRTLARPYSRAIFELAHASGSQQAWSDVLGRLAAAVADPQLAGLVDHPALSRDQICGLFDALLPQDAPEQARNMIRLLARNHRLRLLGVIASGYEALRAEAEQRVEVEVTSAAPVEQAQRDHLAAALRKHLRREVNLHWQQDDTLIGGAIVRAGDVVIDGSVAGELAKLRQALVV